ncbi:SufD family Fe-S cluster assembly protein [Patescibacteria group bacterium]|nr:SufD family Fe-S cluster assembly protein [Patescibacteria group bacterium]MBU1472227.1 SufD family Fe-S cluster assembly protein [Patescibacteria group bacterium]MBU2460521.1 SufD family Fe-S cluster assembly protein [Patescibacteria group bacterium]
MSFHIGKSEKKTIFLEVGRHIADEYVVGRGADLTLVLLVEGDWSDTIRLNVRLAGERAKADIIAIVVGRGEQRFALETVQLHEAPRATSRLLVKSVLWEGASFQYHGMIRVAKSAQQTDACQRNENLLLSDGSRVQTRPELEILANDVRCTHAAATSTVDPQTLWYLKTRGIREEQGRRLVTQGFLEDAIGRISDTIVQSKVRNVLHLD